MHKYRAVFAKGDEVKYLSHLDLTRALPRAFRRAQIPLGYSQGYHPMPLIQYGPALGVGTAGERELIDFETPDYLSEHEFLDRINAVLPEGLRFKSLERLPETARTIIKEINRAEYSVSLDAPELAQAAERTVAEHDEFRGMDFIAAHRRLADDFLAREECLIERARKGKLKEIDVRRFVTDLEVDVRRGDMRIVIEVSPNGSVKPIEVLAAVYGLDDEQALSLSSRVRRLRLFMEEGNESAPGASGQSRLATQSAAGD